MTLFKIDENLHPDLASFMRQHGHDVVTVWDEGLRGTATLISGFNYHRYGGLMP